MSFGGPPPSTIPPSGPFEASMTQIAGSPYTLAAAIFLINVGGRFLPMEITKEQEQFMNQPLFRRFIIFVILFLATRNIITAAWMSLIIILCIGYLFNENSSLCLFGKGKFGTCKSKTAAQTISLTVEEQAILKSLQDKAAKIKEVEPPKNTNESTGLNLHEKYESVISKLVGN